MSRSEAEGPQTRAERSVWPRCHLHFACAFERGGRKDAWPGVRQGPCARPGSRAAAEAPSPPPPPQRRAAAPRPRWPEQPAEVMQRGGAVEDPRARSGCRRSAQPGRSSRPRRKFLSPHRPLRRFLKSSVPSPRWQEPRRTSRCGPSRAARRRGAAAPPDGTPAGSPSPRGGAPAPTAAARGLRAGQGRAGRAALT